MAFAFSLLISLSSFVPAMPGGQAEYGNEETPSFYITPEVFGFGVAHPLSHGFGEGSTFRIGGIDMQYWRVRVGTSLLEAGYSGWSMSVLPVRLGFTLWRRPQKYLWQLYGMLPEVYIQTTTTLWPWRIDPPPYDSIISHTELRAAADIFGVGLDVGAGVSARYRCIGHPVPYKWEVYPVVDARVRLGVTNFGF